MKKMNFKAIQIKNVFKFIFVIFCILNCYSFYHASITRMNVINISDSDNLTYEIFDEKSSVNQSFNSPTNTINGIITYFDYPNSIVNEASFYTKLTNENTGEWIEKSLSFTQLPEDGKFQFIYDKSLKKTEGDIINFELKIKSEDSVIYLAQVNESDEIQLSVLTSDYNVFQKAFMVFSILITLYLIFSIFSKYFTQCNLIKLFIVGSFLFGVTINFMIPVGNMPDESRHIYTAYHYSNKILGINDSSKGIIMRSCDNISFKMNNVSYGEMNNYYVNLFSRPENTSLTTTTNQPLNVSLYWYTYIPQTIGITIGRLLNFGGELTFILGRFFNLLAYIGLVVIAFLIIPKMKSHLYFVSMLPMTLHQATSFSYDAITFGLSFCVFAFTLRLFENSKIQRWNQFIGVICSFALLFCKQFAYFPLAIAPICVYLYKKFKLFWNCIVDWIEEHKRKVLAALGIIVILYGCSCLLFGSFLRLNSPFYFMFNPLELLSKINQSVDKWDIYYYRTLFTGGYGWDEIQAPELLNIFYFGLLVYVCFTGKFDDRKNDYYLRMLFVILSCITVYGLLYVFQNQTSPDLPYIWGIQGRYFTPLLLPIMYSISSKRLQEINQETTIAFLTNALCYIMILEVIYTRTLM